MERIIKALKSTQDEYEHIVLQQWLNWCGKNSGSFKETQKLCANTKLFNWWYRQFRIYERQFLENVGPYLNTITKNDAYLMWYKSIARIHIHFSQPLIRKAKKTNINE